MTKTEKLREIKNVLTGYEEDARKAVAQENLVDTSKAFARGQIAAAQMVLKMLTEVRV